VRVGKPSMERNLQLVLAYDGTDFHGWQRQAGLRTVQAEVEGVLQRVLRHPVHVQGASRTDAGVHARGQVAHVRTTAVIPADKLLRAMNDRLPEDVAVRWVSEVPPTFHASRDARAKLYRYRIFNATRRPVENLAQRYTWHVRFPLDAQRMQSAAQALVGTHDFAALASQGYPRPSTIRTIWRVDVVPHGEELVVDVEGDGFLYHQVRNIVGTLVEIGRGHWPPERMAEILASRDRTRAGPTAPPQGLCLEWIRYSEDTGQPVGYDTEGCAASDGADRLFDRRAARRSG